MTFTTTSPAINVSLNSLNFHGLEAIPKKTVFCGLSVRGTDAARKKCENFPHLTNIGNNFLAKKFEDFLPFHQDFYPFHQYWFFWGEDFLKNSAHFWS